MILSKRFSETNFDPYLYENGKPGGHLPTPFTPGASVDSSGNRSSASHDSQEGVEHNANDKTVTGAVPPSHDHFHEHGLSNGGAITHSHSHAHPFGSLKSAAGHNDSSAHAHDHRDVNAIVNESPDISNVQQVQEELRDHTVKQVMLSEKCDYTSALRMASKQYPSLFRERIDYGPRYYPSEQDYERTDDLQSRKDEIVSNIMAHDGCDFKTALLRASRENRELFMAHAR